MGKRYMDVDRIYPARGILADVKRVTNTRVP
jgi:hypothetical protein